MTYKEIHRRALEIWRSDQAAFPIRCRRMEPDELDYVSGAFARTFEQAALELGWKPGDVIDGGADGVAAGQ